MVCLKNFGLYVVSFYIKMKGYLNSLDSFRDDVSVVHSNQRNIYACHFTQFSGPNTYKIWISRSYVVYRILTQTQ